MALSPEELELETADYLPAREVMSLMGLLGYGGGSDTPGGDNETGGLLGLDLKYVDAQIQGIGGQVNDTLNDSFNDWVFLNGNDVDVFSV